MCIGALKHCLELFNSYSEMEMTDTLSIYALSDYNNYEYWVNEAYKKGIIKKEDIFVWFEKAEATYNKVMSWRIENGLGFVF